MLGNIFFHWSALPIFLGLPYVKVDRKIEVFVGSSPKRIRRFLNFGTARETKQFFQSCKRPTSCFSLPFTIWEQILINLPLSDLNKAIRSCTWIYSIIDVNYPIEKNILLSTKQPLRVSRELDWFWLCKLKVLSCVDIDVEKQIHSM